MVTFRRPPQAGWIARARNDSRGLGKVIGDSGNRVTIEYFVSVSRQEHASYERNDVVHVPLANQTRCYVFSEDEQRWYMGRIGERDGAEYEINLPDRTSFYLSEAQIYVRSAALPDDPTDTLSVYGHETAYFYEARRRLVRSLVQQRATARGMTGLTSSRIELFPHQIEVVRRVLEDPVQRYLLADEVGLGKTVEAGIIIRQFLLDDQNGRVLVLVPPLLVDQWRGELDTKFDAFRGDRVLVLSTLDLERVPERANVGLLVIDEAHHIAAFAASAHPFERGRFDACRRLAHQAERLLLLSATPAANHEAQFLTMLHLLDPQTYRLEDVEQFRARVEKRREIGGVLLTLTETARPYSLRLSLDRLRGLFPDDEILAGYILRLSALLDNAPGDPDGRARAIRAIRTHISETYRLHRRMLRNRRSALDDVVQARSSHQVRVHHDQSEATSYLMDVLEEWRALAAAAVREEGDDGSIRRGLRRCFMVFAQAADGSPLLLEAAARCRLGEIGGSADALTTEFSADAVLALRETPHFANEQQVLRLLAGAAAGQAGQEHRIRATVDLLRDVRNRAGIAAPPKCIVFTGFTSTARLLADRLTGALGRGAVASHLAGIPHEIIEAGVERFRTKHDCFVLVCDSSGEEGRNFQFAEHLVHYDLPWHPNRLEQRIGRVDRISRRRDLTMHVLLGPDLDHTLDSAWYMMLSQGFALFSSSIASLQFYVDAHMPSVVDRAFREGGQGLRALAAVTKAEIVVEQEKVEEQAAIDEIDTREEGAQRFFTRLDDLDAEYAGLEAAVEGWLCKVLAFSRETNGLAPGIVRYRADRHTLVPIDVLRGSFNTFLDRFGAYDRTVATQHPGSAVYRLGDGLIDALAGYIAWDDRGQSFAIWREDPGWDGTEGAEWAGFRFDLIIEADTDSAWAVLERHGADGASRQALGRRADALLPPRTETVFIDLQFAEVIDAALLTRLRRPFSKNRTATGQDYNLTKRRTSVIDSIVSSDEWEGLCRQACDASLRLVRERQKFRDYNEEHAGAATRTLGVKIEQLRLRMARSGAADVDATGRDVELEHELGGALARGIREPRVRVDSAGFIVISGRGPLPEGTGGPAVPDNA
jgi:ATP-dependent helicase HepA